MYAFDDNAEAVGDAFWGSFNAEVLGSADEDMMADPRPYDRPITDSDSQEEEEEEYDPWKYANPGGLEDVAGESDDHVPFEDDVESSDDWQVFAIGDRDEINEPPPGDLPRSIFHATPSLLFSGDIKADHDGQQSLAYTLSTMSDGPDGPDDPDDNPRASRKPKGGAAIPEGDEGFITPFTKRHTRLLLVVIAMLLLALLGIMVAVLMSRKGASTGDLTEISRDAPTRVPTEDGGDVLFPTPIPASNTPRPTPTPVGAGLPTAPVTPQPPTVSSDPPNKYCGMQTPGMLVIDGGELERSPDVATIRAIVEAIGGLDKSLVVIPSAGANLDEKEEAEYARLWTQEIGFDADRFSVLHPQDNNPNRVGVEDADEAFTQAFVAPLQTSDAVFVRGGRQWRLVDAFKYTRVLDEMWNILERGGVIAGTSAGATSQGFFMPRGDPDGSDQLIADREWHQYGFGFLPGVAFDVHVDGRNRWEDMYEVLAVHPELLGIGISEYTAIVVRGRYFQVVGEATVGVYKCMDSFSCNIVDSPYLELFPGDWFDLCEMIPVTEPDDSDMEVTAPRAMSLPYDFKDDYRLGGNYFSCSGRYCRWTSSVIDTADFTSTVISARLESLGEMEPVDFVRVSFRIEIEAPGVFGEWSDNRTFFSDWVTGAEQVGDIGTGYFFTSVTLGDARKMQIRIDAQTSVEGLETLVVRDLVSASAYVGGT